MRSPPQSMAICDRLQLYKILEMRSNQKIPMPQSKTFEVTMSDRSLFSTIAVIPNSQSPSSLRSPITSSGLEFRSHSQYQLHQRSYQIRLNNHTKKSQKSCRYGMATTGKYPDLISQRLQLANAKLKSEHNSDFPLGRGVLRAAP